MNRHWVGLIVLCASWLAIAPVVTFAQDAAAPAAAPPAATPPAGPGSEAVKAALAKDPKRDPAVQSILESNPETPAERLLAASLLTNLGYPTVARPFLAQVLEAKLDDEGLAALGREIESPRLIQLGREAGLQPEAAQLVEAIFAASDRTARDPARLTALLPKLMDPVTNVREAALQQMVPGREDAVKVLLHAMSTAQTPRERKAYTNALVGLGSIAIDPLLGALEGENEAFRVQVIVALGLLEVRRAALLLATPALEDADSPVGQAAQAALKLLVGSVPSRAQAAVAMEKTIKQYLSGPPALPVNFARESTLWHWNADQQQIESKDYPAADVNIVLAAQLAHELARLEPQNREYQRLYLMTLLEAARLRTGFDKPLPTGAGTAHDLAAAAGVGLLQEVLEYSLAGKHFGAAAAAAELLGESGDQALLADGSGQPTPLVSAVHQGDRRVRFAALAAIMKLDPRSPFPGASYVTEALGYFVSYSGEPHVAIGYPRPEEGQTIAGELAGLGYEAEVAYTGRELVELTERLPDLQFILIHALITKPDIREVLYDLRRVAKTAEVPIIVYASVDGLEKLRRIAAEFELVLATPRPHSAEDLKSDLTKLQRLAGRNLVTGEEAHGQAVQALGWIALLAERNRVPYEMQRLNGPVLKALYYSHLAADAAPVLALLKTAEGQQQMVNLASLRTTPIELRRVLAKAFHDSIQRQGLLLTSKQIVAQYDRYNLSAAADADTQEVLGLLLNAIEAPTKKAEPAKTE